MTINQINRRLGIENERVNVWQYKGAADVKAAKTAADALKAAGMDWLVEQEPVINQRTNDKTRYVYNYRNDNNGLLGIVGNNYVPLQNHEAFKFIDSLTPNGVSFETVGITEKGNRLWMCVKIDEVEILGDTIDNYMVAQNFHDGSGSYQVAMTPSRRFCHNCLSYVFKENRGASRVHKIRHSQSMQERMKEARQVFGLTQQYMDALALEAEQLSKIKVAPRAFEDMSEKLFPILEEDNTLRIDNQERKRYLLKKAWEVDDLANHKGTGWGFINAVADYEQHRALKGENALNTVIDGSRLLQTAYEMVLEQ